MFEIGRDELIVTVLVEKNPAPQLAVYFSVKDSTWQLGVSETGKEIANDWSVVPTHDPVCGQLGVGVAVLVGVDVAVDVGVGESVGVDVLVVVLVGV